MTALTKQPRFMGNNFTTASSSTVTVSSEAALFPASNLQNTQRYKHWSPEGNFEITTSNYKMYYVEDTFAQTITLTTGSYTGATLAAEIQSKMVGSTFTVTFDSTNLFTITKTDGGTLDLTVSNTLFAIWDVIGFTGSTDLTGSTAYTSDSIRIHTSETIDWDLGSDIKCTFFALIAKRENEFTLTSSAVITLEADSIPIGASPALALTLTRGSEGVFEFLDSNTDHTYRYWKLTIVDRENPLGSSGIKIGVAYLGDHITLSSRGMEKGFKKTQIDPSLKNTSESGATYYKIKNRYTRFSSLTMPFLTAVDRKAIEQFFYDHGNFKPFFLSMDPMLSASTDLQELTKYVKFDGDPSVTHIKTDVYTIQFNAREDL